MAILHQIADMNSIATVLLLLNEKVQVIILSVLASRYFLALLSSYVPIWSHYSSAYPELGIIMASSVLLYKKDSACWWASPNPPRTVLRTGCAPEESGTFYCRHFATIKKRADSSLMTATCPMIIGVPYLVFSCCRPCSSSIFRKRSMSCFAIW